jgi:hypothetical protein
VGLQICGDLGSARGAAPCFLPLFLPPFFPPSSALRVRRAPTLCSPPAHGAGRLRLGAPNGKQMRQRAPSRHATTVPGFGPPVCTRRAGLARHKTARRACAWAVSTAPGLSRHGTVELMAGLSYGCCFYPLSVFKSTPTQMGRVWVENNYPLKKWGG